MPRILHSKRLLTGLVVLTLLLAAIPAYVLANHQAGSTYSGASDENGSVTVVTSSDGLLVQNFQANDLPADIFGDCPEVIDINLSNIPIQGFGDYHYFDRSELINGITVDVNGDFDIPGFVTGYISLEKSGTDCFNFVAFATSIGGSGGGNANGDVNCDESVDVIDALAVLQHEAGFTPNQQPGCPPIVG